MNPVRWRDAMDQALYGPGGFFVSGAGPAAHFRTSVHATPAFSSCLLRLLTSVDRVLGHPPRLDVVDVGAGRGELLRALLVGVSGEPTAPVPLADRIRLTAVERAPRPDDLPAEVHWTDEIPERIIGLLVATEWLDNVPLDLAVHTADGWRYLLVDPLTGSESPGPPLTPEDTAWLTHWWPTPTSSIKEFASPRGPEPDANLLINGVVGARVEVGRGRDVAWAEAVSRVERGVAVAVDYGHLREGRPVDGTLTGYRDGRQVPPVPDGSCDVTAHVAMDSAASAGERVARCAYTLVSQREALRALGADGGRPPLSLASRDPAGYVRALAAASAVAELTDPAGLGGHWWLLQPVGVAFDPVMAR
ncbi:SAM-dependent methyltransferase [Micromonospora eburnea]|uniref:SAM-dependent methyltransferase, MidA family n=1 Tax=Micromonospora eburnea TaxID=227316 RepID=A0A1C6VMA8_9ACTN|nr:SAM-dependent methyltransferase [Micromonospora eburnea]SCL67441.1 SAM-dependent methyltransferase, MidA family [Micromonospora eburnea]